MPCASAAPPSPRRATGVPANSSKILLERRNLDAMPPYAPPVSPAPDERAQPARVPAPKHPAFSRSIAGATLAGDCSFFLSSCSMRAQSLCRCSTCACEGVCVCVCVCVCVHVHAWCMHMDGGICCGRMASIGERMRTWLWCAARCELIKQMDDPFTLNCTLCS